MFGSKEGASCPYPASSSAASSAMTSTRSCCAVTIPKFMSLMTSRHCGSASATCATKRAHWRAQSGVKRAARGRREQSLPGTAEHPLQRKQVFAAALKRVNREIHRMEKLEARTVHIEAARRVLAMRRAAQFPPRPQAGDTPSEGMHPMPSQRRRTRVPPARIGSVSQATRNAQAARDARNRSVE